MQPKKTFEQVLENVRKDFDDNKIIPKKQFIVLYNGTQVNVYGRSVWDEVGKAKRSLNRHIKCYLWNSEVTANEIINELLATGEIEFKEL